MERSFGVFLPVSAIESKYGFGCFSKEAYDFVDSISQMGAKFWQIQPLYLSGNDNNPYLSESAFAGDPVYIDLEKYLTDEEIDFFRLDENLDYATYKEKKYEALEYVFDKLYYQTNIDKFTEDNENWVYDFAVYMTLKREFKCDYENFPKEYKNVDSKQTITFIKSHSQDIVFHIFLQYLFFMQWRDLKKYANKRGIKIVASVSAELSLDSSDYYAHRNIFDVFDNGKRIFSDIVSENNKDNTNSFLAQFDDYFVASSDGNGDKFIYISYDNFHSKNKVVLLSPEKVKTEKSVWFLSWANHLLKMYDSVIFYTESEENSELSQRKSELFSKIMDIIKDVKLKNIILYEKGNNFFEENLAEQLNDKNVTEKRIVFAESAFCSVPEKNDLPTNYCSKDIVYLTKPNGKTFCALLESENFKRKVCAYLNLGTETENQVIVRLMIENLLLSNAGTCIVGFKDIFGISSGEDFVFRLKKDYAEDKYLTYLADIVKNKNR